MEKLRQTVVVFALLGLVFALPAFILWCGPALYFANTEMCEALGVSNLWHIFVLACGVALVLVAPRAMGLRLGLVRKHLVLIGVVTVVALALSALGAALLPENPFEDGPVGMWLMTPVGEELIFRGFAYTLLLWAFPTQRTQRWGLSYAVVGSALLFGVWHIAMLGNVGFAWAQAAYTALAGLMLGVMRERTGSVLPCVTTHMGANYVAALV